jgi:hypothetical protein
LGGGESLLRQEIKRKKKKEKRKKKLQLVDNLRR